LVQCSFFLMTPPTTALYPLPLHDALQIEGTSLWAQRMTLDFEPAPRAAGGRSEEHTSELQSLAYLVCRLLLAHTKASSCRRECERRVVQGAVTDIATTHT